MTLTSSRSSDPFHSLLLAYFELKPGKEPKKRWLSEASGQNVYQAKPTLHLNVQLNLQKLHTPLYLSRLHKLYVY